MLKIEKTSETTRRLFVAGAGACLVGSAISTVWGPPSKKASQVSGTIHAIGSPPLSIGNIASRSEQSSSILVSVDVESQQVRHTELPLSRGHSVVYMGGGRLLCVAHHGSDSLVLDGSNKLLKRLHAPTGYVFGGHALVRPNGSPIVCIPMRHENPKSLSDTGLIAAFDVENLELLQLVKSGGVHPHEIAVIPGTGELAVSHYGNLHLPALPMRHNAVEARLAILELSNLEVLRHYDVPEYRAMLTHMKVMDDGCAYCVLTQYVMLENSLTDDAERMLNARQEMERLYARKFGFTFPPQARAQGMVAVPLPFLRINTQTGQRDPVLLGEDLHLRSQSVAVNSAMQIAVATYPHSNTLVLYGTDGNASVLHGDKIGLPEVRGVSDIPGSPMIAVSSTYSGLSIVDLRTQKLVTHIASRQYDAPHINYAPSSSGS